MASTGGGAAEPRGARPNFLRGLLARFNAPPRLSCELLPSGTGACTSEVRLRPSEAGAALERGWLGRWSVLCDLTHSGAAWALVPRASTPVQLNGLPVTAPTSLSSGDVLTATTEGVAVRLLVKGAPLRSTASTQAEWFGRALAMGLLSIEEGPAVPLRRAVLRWRGGDDDSLVAFARTPLARSLSSLDVVLCRRPHLATVDATTVKTLAKDLGELLPRTRFVVPAQLSLPDEIAVRLAEPVEVHFDGAPVALDAPTFLTGSPQGLRLDARYAPAPFLFALGRAAFLSCEEGWGALEALGRAGCDAAVAGGRAFQVPLLAGDEWRLVSKGRQHRLTVHPASSAPVQRTRRRPKGGPPPLVFEGEELRSVTLHLAEGDIQFTQDASGLFHGPWPRPFAVAGPGQLKWFRGDERPFSPYDILFDEQSRPLLLLPSPSAFLRGRSGLPEHPLTRETLIVFLDLLLERHDGAALALRRLIDADPEDRPRWFSRLLVDADHRRHLAGWLELERESLSLFEPVVRATRADHALALLRTVRTEPILRHLREVHVDLPAAESPPSLPSEPRSAGVRVVWRRDGRLVDA